MPDQPDRPLATVIVPVRNAADIVTEQLDALRDQVVGGTLEVVVVDDASTDATGERVRAWIDRDASGRFTLVERARRGGPNASRNDGIRRARSDFLLFCDGDDVVTPGWAAAMLGARAQRAVLGGGLLRLGADPAEPASWVHAERVEAGWPFALGGSLGIERALAIELDGWDENILAGGTEFDFSVRAQAWCGATVVAVPDAVVGYREPSSSHGVLARELRRERGRAYIARKLAGELPGYRGWRHHLTIWKRLLWWCRAALGRNPAAPRMLAQYAGRALGGTVWAVRFRFQLPAPRGLSAIGP